MEKIEFSSMEGREAYKLISGLIVPRPIAWVTTLADNGKVNAAPFSFFNVFGSRPPLVIIGIGKKPDGGQKDTAYNLTQRRLAVIHLAEANMATAMNQTSATLPDGESELEAFGLEAEPIPDFPVPAIKGTRVRLLCEWVDQPVYGSNHLHVLEVKAAQLANGIRDSRTGFVSPDYKPIGRLAGTGYCTTNERFDMDRPA